MDKMKERASRLQRKVSSESNGKRQKTRRLGIKHFKRNSAVKQFLSAVEKGDMVKVRDSLEQGVDLVDMEEGEKAVRLACEYGREEMLSVLIQFGAPLNAFGENDTAPLHIAARLGHTALMTLLLSYEANPNIATKFDKRTPAHLAAMNGNVDALKLLIERDSHTRLDQSDIYGSTPLNLATVRCRTEAVRLLLGHRDRVDVNKCDNEGWTPLHMASERGDEETARLLLEHHASVDPQNKYGRTPLHWACSRGHKHIIRLLVLEYNANPDIKDSLAKTAIDYASDPGMKLLLEASYDLEPSSRSGGGDRNEKSETIGSHIRLKPRDSIVAKSYFTTKQERTNPCESILSRLARMSSVDEASDSDDSSDETDVDESVHGRPRTNYALNKNKCIVDGSATSLASSNTTSVSDHPSTVTSNEPTGKRTLGEDILQKDPNAIRIGIADKSNNEDPEEAKVGLKLMTRLMSLVFNQNEQVGSTIQAVSSELAGAAAGRIVLSTNDFADINKSLYKLQRNLIDFREEFETNAKLVHTMMETFPGGLAGRLTTRESLGLSFYHAFFSTAASYLGRFKDSWARLIQLLNLPDEETKNCVRSVRNNQQAEEDRVLTTLFQVVGRHVQPATLIRTVLGLVNKCALEDNSSQQILQNFTTTCMQQYNVDETIHKQKLLSLSLRLGSDGWALGKQLGVPVDDDDLISSQLVSGQSHQESNRHILSSWMTLSSDSSTKDCLYDLVEALIVVGREDLLGWVFADEKDSSQRLQGELSKQHHHHHQQQQQLHVPHMLQQHKSKSTPALNTNTALYNLPTDMAASAESLALETN